MIEDDDDDDYDVNSDSALKLNPGDSINVNFKVLNDNDDYDR